MSEIIASTYEIIGQIGAGGGGVVYLANHLRLGKRVVLKADKRKLSARPEALRREVDVLKDLSHAYIPQVYDYFTEDGNVYTVMDYIEGESLDKPLRRGERFAQAVVIGWARQLLEALCYLHSPIHGTPPHGIVHSDIKPANVMLTRYGSICLIDFNIALALGEENVIGRSEGYASPEYYGLDFSTGGTAFQTGAMPAPALSADAADELAGADIRLGPTEVMGTPAGAMDSGGSGRRSGTGYTRRKIVVPDARTDIYSLGATLYHLLSGRRPAKNVLDVAPLSPSEFSPLITQIIAKAMNPNPDLRYQTAADMLYALEHLRERDPRWLRLRRQRLMAGIITGALLLGGGFTAFVGQKRLDAGQKARLLAEYAGNALSAGDVAAAVDFALEALPAKSDLFTPPAAPAARSALTEALGVYDLADGFKPHRALTLPSAPLYLAIAPDGRTGACVYAGSVAVFDTATARVIATLPAEQSALAELRFLNNDVIVYAGRVGLAAYDFRRGAELWSGRLASAVALSADGQTVAAVYKEESQATVYHFADGSVSARVDFAGRRQRVTVNDSFANPNDNLFALSGDGNWLGASFADGSLTLFNLRNTGQNIELFDTGSGYTHFEGGFSGQYFAFSATNQQESVFAVIDTLAGEQTGGFADSGYFGVQVDESGIYVQSENLLVRLHPVSGEQTPLVATGERIIRFARSAEHTLMTSEEELLFFDARAGLIARRAKGAADLVQLAAGTALIGGLDSPVLRIMRYENHPEAAVFNYDPALSHDEVRVSADGRTVMLFSFEHFRLFAADGRLINETAIPEAEQIYDQQYRRDENGSRLEVIYNDGRVRAYSAIDGSLLVEDAVPPPDLSLYEEFFTDELRITSPLHGTPAAYDRGSGRLVRELERDAYLTYVTQFGEYIVTEYVNAAGRRFGLLLDGRCETLATLPYLCDILGDELYFDYPTGNVRKSRLYPIDELIGLARGNKF